MMMMNLSEMTIEELKALRAQWYKVAKQEGTLDKIAAVARALGQDPVSIREPGYVSTYGPKYLLIIGSDESTVSVYVDDYGHYMTVHASGKLMCSTHDTNPLFVPGEWVGVVLARHDAAQRKDSEQRASAGESERQKLLAELSLSE